MNHNNENYCTVKFPTDADMNKAFDMIIHGNSRDGFTGVNDNTIIVSLDICKKLEEMVGRKELNYDHVNHRK